MKKWIIGIVVAVIAIGAGTWFIINKKQQNENASSQSISTATVKKGELQVAVTGSGSVETKVSRDITAENTELTVESVDVSSGESVSNGDTLITFTNGDKVSASFDGEVASISVSSGSTADKNTILMRITNENDITSVVTRGNNSSNNDSSNGGNPTSLVVNSLFVSEGDTIKKGAKIATFTDGSTLRSPVKGTVTSLSIDSGDSIDSSKTVAHITDYKALQTSISVDELDISKIKVGQKVELTASAFEDQKFTGKVSKIEEEGSPSNGVSTFNVIVDISKPKNLKVGMSTEASILIEDKSDALYVPIEAVYSNQDEKYVLVPNEDGQSSEKVTVKTGISNDIYVEILSGVKEGTSVQIPQVQSSGSFNGSMKGDMNGGGMPPGGFSSDGNRPEMPSGNRSFNGGTQGSGQGGN